MHMHRENILKRYDSEAWQYHYAEEPKICDDVAFCMKIAGVYAYLYVISAYPESVKVLCIV